MEQQQTAGEDEKRPVGKHVAHSIRRLVGARSRRRAVRTLRVDLRWSDLTQRQQRRDQQQDGDDKDGARRQKISASTHGGRREAVANRRKASVAPQPFADRRMTDEAKADRHHGGTQDATCQRLNDRRRQHHGKDRMRRVGQSADANRRNRDAGDQSLRPRGVDECAAGHLADQRNEAGGGQDETDVDLRPLLRGEKDRDERPKASLHIGDEEDEPIKPAQAARRRPQRRLRSAGLLAKRRRGSACDPVAPISTVAKAA